MSINCNGANAIQMPGPLTATANQAAMSISFWIRLNNLPGADNMTAAVWGTNAGVTRFGINFRNATPGSVRIIARAADADALSSIETVSTTVLTPGQWQHIVGCLNYGTSNAVIYSNAVSLPLVGGGFAFSQGTTSNTNSSVAKIGCNVNNNTSEFVNGLIEDVRLYQRFLSDQEVMTIFTGRGMDGIIQGLASRYLLNDLAELQTVNGVANITATDRIIGTNPTASPMTFDTTMITGRKSQAIVHSR